MIKGNDMVLRIGGEVLGASRSCSLDRSADTIEVCSPADGSAKNYLPTTTGWTISASGLYATKEYASRLRKIWRDYQSGVRTALQVQVVLSGAIEEGSAYMTSLQEQGGLGELVKFNITLQGSGMLLKGGVSLTFAKAKDDTTMEVSPSVIFNEDEDDQIEYVDINVDNSFRLNFDSVSSWIVLPGTHTNWDQDLDSLDEHGAIAAAVVSRGNEGLSGVISSGRYVVYGCNMESRIGCKLIEE